LKQRPCCGRDGLEAGLGGLELYGRVCRGVWGSRKERQGNPYGMHTAGIWGEELQDGFRHEPASAAEERTKRP